MSTADPASCDGVCASGWISLAVIANDKSGVARCLCRKGRALAAGVGVEHVLTDAQLDALYPKGRPQVAPGERARDASRVPRSRWRWTLESFAAAMPKKTEIAKRLDQARAWTRLSVDRRPDLVLFGPNGTGKTGLSTAMINALSDNAEHVEFHEARALFIEWRTTYAKASTETEIAFLDRMVGVPTLVLDEAGETQLTDFTTTGLKLLIDRRHGREYPTIFTVNIPSDLADHVQMVAHLASVFGPALYDRLRESAQFWAMLGATVRKPSSKVLPFETRTRDQA